MSGHLQQGEPGSAPDYGGPVRIAVCAATFNRPQGLARLLAAVSALELDDSDRAEIVVVVVDNSPDENARARVQLLAGAYPWPLYYVTEKRRGITFARNAALARAEALSAALIAFVDDDEYPAQTWLRALLARWRSAGAAVVLGTVRPVYPPRTPAWIIKGGFFEKLPYSDGAEVEDAHTANVLIESRALRSHGITFDHRYALTGGEDTMLFRALRDRGERMVYAAEAVVYETVPASRARLSWLMKRWYRTGNTDAHLFLQDGPTVWWRAIANVFRGLLRIATGSTLFIGNLAVLGLGRRERIARPLYTLCRGFGILASSMGKNYREYQQVHGT